MGIIVYSRIWVVLRIYTINRSSPQFKPVSGTWLYAAYTWSLGQSDTPKQSMASCRRDVKKTQLECQRHKALDDSTEATLVPCWGYIKTNHV